MKAVSNTWVAGKRLPPSRRLGTWVLAALALSALLVAGCQQKGEVGQFAHKSAGGTGGIFAQAVWPEGSVATTSSFRTFNNGPLPSNVTQVRLTVSGGDFADMTQTFDVTLRTGVISSVPVGSDRTLVMDALNSSGVIVYSGSTAGITVVAGVTTDAGEVALSLVGGVSGALTITVPAVSSPYTSNDSVLNPSDELTVSGACTSTPEHTVRAKLAGVEKASAACTSGAYSLNLPAEASDGTYLYTFEQQDDFTSNATASLTWTWVLDNFEAPVVLDQTAVTTGSTSVNVTGTCSSSNSIAVAQTPSGTLNTGSCSSGTFSVGISQSGDGTYTYNVIQTDAAFNDSAPEAFTWTVDSTLPFTPVISVPASNASDQSALTGMTFTCDTSEAHTVSVTEDGIQVIGQACSTSPLSVTFSGSSTQMAHVYSVTQTRDLTGIASAAATRTWTVDTTPPAAPAIATPVVVTSGGTYTGPYIAGSTSITVTGSCETGATVTLTGGTTSPETGSCVASAYSLTANGVSLTDYALTLTQTDPAGNTSATPTTLNWRPDTSVPSTPAITNPGSNPYYGNSLTTIAGTCTASDHTVNLSGQATDSQTCSSGGFSFSVTDPGSDGQYTYTLTQTSNVTSITSGSVTLTFNRDNAVSAPGITSPSGGAVTNGASSITIDGTCEANGTVHATGTVTQDQTCTGGGTFSLTNNQTTDNVYTYTFTQTDLAGNTSSGTTVTWTRETVPPAPVITLPASDFYSNSLLTSISGTCVDGLTVTMTGSGTGSTTCAPTGFSFTITDPGADGDYSYSVYQTNGFGNSASATRTWHYDTAAPIATVLDASIVTSNAGTIDITGTCETGAMVYLTDVSGGGAGNQSMLCNTGSFSFTVSQSTTGTFIYDVSQTDPAGNSSGAATQQWNRPAPGYTVTPTSGLSVSESGTTATFTVVLQSTPNGDVVIDVTSSDTTEGTVSGATLAGGKLTFTTANWNVAQTVTITGVDDAAVDGNQTFPVNLSTDVPNTADTTGYKLISPSNVSVTTIDIGAPGVTVTPTSGLVVSESGTQATFSVVLNKAPDGNVVIDVASQDLSEITLDKATLTFNTGNWSTAQIVTLTGEDDALDDGNQTVTITVTTNAGSTADTTGYQLINPADVTAIASDDDTSGFTVTPTTGLVTTEGGSKATFTVALNTSPNPGEIVVLNVASQNTSEVSVDKPTLTFTSLDWYTPQTVTLTGVDDVTIDGNQTTTIALTVNSGLTTDTTGYAALNPTDPAVLNIDNDVAGVTVTPTTLTTSENGSEGEFSVRLNTQPSGNVVILVQNGDSTELTVDKTDLTFTPSDWLTPQYVRVTGKSDALADGNIVVNVALIIDTSLTLDSNYDAVDPADVSVTNLDYTDFVTVNPTSGLQTTDAGGTDSFSVVLNTAPDTGMIVVVNVASQDTNEVTVSNSTLTFDEFSWNTPQTVTLTGRNLGSGGTQIVTVQLTMNGSTTDTGYAALDPSDVTVTNLHLGTPGFTVSKSSVTTSESGASESFTVSIATSPATDVIIDILSNDSGEVTTDKTTLTFNSSNWSNPQTVTAKGVNDTATDGDIATSLTISVNASSDGDYIGLSSKTVNVTNTDNEPNSQGSDTAPLDISSSLPASGSAGTSGTSYYLVTGLAASTAYFVTVSSIVMDNSATFTFNVYTSLANLQAQTSPECTGSEGAQNSGDARPKSCTATSSASGELYIRATNTSTILGATYQVDVVTVPVNEGTTASPIALDYNNLPYDLGQVGNVANPTTFDSYYVITNVPASQNRFVRATNLTQDINLFVYSTSDFTTTLLCSSSASTIAEACNAAIPANGTIYVRVQNVSGQASATFTLDIVAPPSNQGSIASPIGITLGQLPYGGSVIGPSPGEFVAGGSYYIVSGLTPTTTYTISMTELTGGGTLWLYSDATFGTSLCESEEAVNLPEMCQVAADASGKLYINVHPFEINPSNASTFNIRVQ